MTSPKRQLRTLLATTALLLFAVLAATSAQAQDAPAAPVASGPDAGPAAFDPSVPFPSSPGVAYAPEGKRFNIKCFGRWVTILGTSHNDRIYGTSGQDVIAGLGGRDLISSGEKNDFVCGGPGEDQIYTLQGNDRAKGEEQADQLFGGEGDDTLYGLDGDDQMNGEAGTDYMYGGRDNDTMFGGGSSTGETAPRSGAPVPAGIAGDSSDYMFGGPGADTMSGGDLNDNIYGQDGNDTMGGDSGSDRMIGAGGRDTFDGGDGDDTMKGGAAADQFFGGAGNDTAWGDGGLDYINGDEGLDTLRGGEEWDVINGAGDSDTLYGDGGSDTLCGGGGVNTLNGGNQDDFLSGNADNCTFSFKNLLDTFSVDSDVINLNDGGEGTDLCVSPSAALSPQTVRCELDGFYRLNIEINGNGNVSSGGAVGALNEFGFDCDNPGGGVCSMFFLPSDMPINLTLTATPDAGYAFNGWNGVPGAQCPGLTNPCNVTLNASDFPTGTRTITANFVQTATLGITVNGGGTVTSAPAGINCGVTCSSSFNNGQQVTLTIGPGTPAASTWLVSGASVFSGCGNLSATCTVTMSSTNASVTVNTGP